MCGLLLTASTLTADSIAQRGVFDSDWRWVHFTTESGLPSNSVTNILETPDGTVWVATRQGIAWFDGFRWIGGEAISGLTGVSGTIVQQAVGDSILIKSDQGWFIGTRSGFHALPPAMSGSVVLPFQNGSYLIWMEEEHSLYLFENGVRKLFEPHGKTTAGKTITMWQLENGSIWISLVDGLYRWQGNDWKKMFEIDKLPWNVNTVVENRRGAGLMTGGSIYGLWEWHDGSFPKQSLTEKPDVVKAMDVAPNDEAIVVYVSGDVRFRQNGSWSSIALLHSEIKDVLSVKFRPNGDLWVGTDHGLYLCARSTSRWESFKHESPDRRNYLSEILKTHDGTLWVATGDGLEVYGALAPLLPPPLLKSGKGTGGERVYRHIPNILGTTLNVITGLAEDNAGNVWVSSGSAFEGAFRWDGKVWKHFSVCDSCGGVFVHKIRKDRHGRLWFLGLGRSRNASENQPGAFMYENGTFTRWGKREGLPGGRVYSFAAAEDGALWFGTYDGVSRWRPADPNLATAPNLLKVGEGAWTHWGHGGPPGKQRAFALAVDHQGRAWFGNFDGAGSGLGYIDEHDSIRYLTTADGLVDNRIWDIRADSHDKLWVATENGICCYDHGVWTTYDERSGLSHSVIWPVFPLQDNVYIGTQGRGLTILDRTTGITPPPRVIIGKPIVENQDAEVRWNPLSFWAEITPAGILTRYRINEGEWAAWSNEHQLKLHDGRPGDYRLQVQAKGVFGQFDAKGAVVNFTVLPPLLLRRIFYVPAGLTAVIVITLIGILLRRKRKYDLDLRKSEARFRAAMENTSSAILVYADSNILFVNPGAATLTGYEKDELYRMTMQEVIHPDHRESFCESENRRIGRTANPERNEVMILTRNGLGRWVDLTIGWIQFQGVPVSLATAFDITERKQAEEQLISKGEQLRSLATELSLTEERERRRIATYLHDTISQALLLTKNKLESLDGIIPAPSAREPLSEIRALLEQTIENTRTLTFELCPPILYDLGLAPAIDWLVDQIKQAHALRVTFIDDRKPKSLSDEMRDTLYTGAREALMNVVKHAQAKNVWVDVRCQQGEVIVAIEDDGIGFSREATGTEKQKRGEGFGLLNLKHRIIHLGGRMEIETAEGKGTRVTLAAPVEEIFTSQ